MAGRGNGSCRAETRCENTKNGAKKAHEGIKSCDSGEEGEGRRVFVTRAGARIRHASGKYIMRGGRGSLMQYLENVYTGVLRWIVQLFSSNYFDYFRVFNLPARFLSLSRRTRSAWMWKKKKKKKKLGLITFVSFTRSNRSSKIVMTVTVEFYVSFKNVISWLRILRATGKRGK